MERDTVKTTDLFDRVLDIEQRIEASMRNCGDTIRHLLGEGVDVKPERAADGLVERLDRIAEKAAMVMEWTHRIQQTVGYPAQQWRTPPPRTRSPDSGNQRARSIARRDTRAWTLVSVSAAGRSRAPSTARSSRCSRVR